MKNIDPWQSKRITILPADTICRIVANVEIPGHVVSKGFDCYEDAASWAIDYTEYVPTEDDVTGGGRWGCE